MGETLKIEVGRTPEEEMALHKQMLQPRPNVEVRVLPKKNSNESFVIDTSEWKMKQYRKWMRLSTNPNIDEIYEMTLEVLKAWPYDLPLNEEGLDELKPKEWAEVVKAVSENAATNFTT